MSNLRPFHLAVPVNDLVKAREFYGNFLGFEEGRSDKQWIDWNFYGHQFVTHLNPNYKPENYCNSVDEHAVPIPHFGVVLTMEDWKQLAKKLENQHIEFIIKPYIRFEGLPGEQATMFFLDPSGNALEFKAFNNLDSLFAK
ncbi:glyoxalase [Vicingus serpentipes]|uniref:Glyoxalase n=1 Tax=Vicingus serpentipes TaxID=1926625 RepID=A0A5C6RU91_9FLAO|nr:VOC family protein [Vicingus serpentipes]TXB65868.1 glyoxalase [Vicingus serpentipes]